MSHTPMNAALGAALVASALTVWGCTPDSPTDEGDAADAAGAGAVPVGLSNEVDASATATIQTEPAKLVGDGNGDDEALESDATVTDLGESDDAENLQRGLRFTPPTPTLLDADGLTLVFQRLFSPTDPAVDGSGAWFSAVERKALGGFDFLSRAADQRNLARSTEMSLPYMRALRGFLGRGCGNLVTRELAAVAAGNATANLLVRRAAEPTAAHVEAAMREVFGIRVGRVQGAAEYAAVFAANMAAAPTTETPAQTQLRVSANYTLMCIAIGMDPRAYLR